MKKKSRGFSLMLSLILVFAMFAGTLTAFAEESGISSENFIGCWESDSDNTWLCIYEDGTYEWYYDEEEFETGSGTWYMDGAELCFDDDEWGETTFTYILEDSSGETLFESELPEFDYTVDEDFGDLLSCWEYDEYAVWICIYDDDILVAYNELGYQSYSWYQDGTDLIVEDADEYFSPLLSRNYDTDDLWFESELPDFDSDADEDSGEDTEESVEADEVALTPLGGTDGANSDEEFDNLFDGDVETKWCVTSFDFCYAKWAYDVPVCVTGFIITTANDNAEYPGRNPTSWSLYGYNGDEAPLIDDDDWAELVCVEDDTFLEDENYAEFHYSISEELPAYQYYLLLITDNGGADAMQMSEFTLTYTVGEVEKTEESEDAAETASYDLTDSFIGCWESNADYTWLLIYEDGTYEWYESDGDVTTGSGTWYMDGADLCFDDDDWGSMTYMLFLLDDDDNALIASERPDSDYSDLDDQVGTMISCWKYEEWDQWFSFHDDGSCVIYDEDGGYQIVGWYEDGKDMIAYDDEGDELGFSPRLLDNNDNEMYESELPDFDAY